jgi:3-oxoacyl-[acyl-carrier protein] reductase
MRLDDKVCFITGASRGIGRGIAVSFAKEGAKVVIGYHENIKEAKNTSRFLEKLNCENIILKFDVKNRKSVQKAVRETLDSFGCIDVLVNNAGINKQKTFYEISDDEWDLIMAVNLKGAFICSQEIMPIMEKQKNGRIINISSVSGQYGGPKTVHYAVSKAGIISLTQVLARYGAPYNILVNAIAPGIIETDLTRDELKTDIAQQTIDWMLLKRPGQVADVSSVAVMLASDEQNFITGQTISVNGGSYFGR